MKTSNLIAELAKLMSECGDVEIEVRVKPVNGLGWGEGNFEFVNLVAVTQGWDKLKILCEKID